MSDYHLIVIGAGPGGYVAAIKAAQLGKKVMLVEKDKLGGTCLNRGCVPTKTLLHSAETYSHIKSCEFIGICVENATIDIKKMYERKDEVLDTLRKGIEGLIKFNKIDLISGEAYIQNKNCVKVDETAYTCDNILIATGSKPAKLNIKGIDLLNVVTSDELLTNSDIDFNSLTIIGGGVIGVEFASIYNALGIDVTIVEGMERILPLMDKEISQNLSMILKKRGIKIFTGAKVEEITQAENDILCKFTAKGKQETLPSKKVLVSIGRSSNTEGLFHADLGISVDKNQIIVNDKFETSIKGVYAVGDVIKDGIQLAHVASAQGINAVCNMFGIKPDMNLKVIPSCIYTSPEIASVGITADEAKHKGIAVKTGKFIMSANGKTIIEKGDRGFVKIVCKEDTEEILGAQLMCTRATDMIGEFVTAISNKLTVSQMIGTIRPHPSFNEGIGEAIDDILGHAIHINKR